MFHIPLQSDLFLTMNGLVLSLGLVQVLAVIPVCSVCPGGRDPGVSWLPIILEA